MQILQDSLRHVPIQIIPGHMKFLSFAPGDCTARKLFSNDDGNYLSLFTRIISILLLTPINKTLTKYSAGV